MPTGTTAQLELRLLGAFACSQPANVEGVAISTRAFRLPTRKAEALFAYLVLHPAAHPREKLAGLLWGDSRESQARGSLRQALSLLRTELGEDIVLTDRLAAQLNPSFPLWVDTRAFEAQARAFLAAPERAMVDLALYRGDLLTDFYDDWIVPLREHFRSTYLRAALEAGRMAEARGDSDESVALNEAVLRVDPANEEAHRGLIAGYARIGRRNAALEQYARCERILHNELDVGPSPETIALFERIKSESALAGARRPPPGAASTASPPLAADRELPMPATSFVGRQRELAELRRILPTARLLTLTGVVGGGKTRLALALARERALAYAQGVCWVDLACVTAPPGPVGADSIARTILRNLGQPEAPDRRALVALGDALSRSAMLLTLDGCGHVVRPCSQVVAELSRTCPQLDILVTSREPLGLPSERTWQVPPLQLPQLRSGPLGQVLFDDVDRRVGREEGAGALIECDSVRLFVERAVNAWPAFRLTGDNSAAVARICWRVDGVPLAIELAATQVGRMRVAELADELENRLGALIHGDTIRPGYRMLSGLLSWNYSLLEPSEQILLRRLSVFAGEFTAADAAGICPGAGLEPSALEDLLLSLVDKSFVERSQPAEGTKDHFRLLSIIAEYGRDRLASAGEQDALCDAFLDHYGRLAATAEPDRLQNEAANLRRALAWATERGASGTARVLSKTLGALLE